MLTFILALALFDLPRVRTGKEIGQPRGGLKVESAPSSGLTWARYKQSISALFDITQWSGIPELHALAHK